MSENEGRPSIEDMIGSELEGENLESSGEKPIEVEDAEAKISDDSEESKSQEEVEIALEFESKKLADAAANIILDALQEKGQGGVALAAVEDFFSKTEAAGVDFQDAKDDLSDKLKEFHDVYFNEPMNETELAAEIDAIRRKVESRGVEVERLQEADSQTFKETQDSQKRESSEFLGKVNDDEIDNALGGFAE